MCVWVGGGAGRLGRIASALIFLFCFSVGSWLSVWVVVLQRLAFGGNGVAFTSKMREDMFHTHAKLTFTDAEVGKAVNDASVPTFEQLNVLHLQAQVLLLV